jgi:hypothetical protein
MLQELARSLMWGGIIGFHVFLAMSCFVTCVPGVPTFRLSELGIVFGLAFGFLYFVLCVLPNRIWPLKQNNGDASSHPDQPARR